jgi:hypothetical protein
MYNNRIIRGGKWKTHFKKIFKHWWIRKEIIYLHALVSEYWDFKDLLSTY